jgi:hypothetical protein
MNSQQARQAFNQFVSEGDEEASQSIKNRANQFSLNEEPDELATNSFSQDEDFGVSNSFSGESLYNFSANTGQTKVKPQLDGVQAQAIFDLVNSHEGAMVNNGANLLITSGGKKLFETDENGMVTFAISQRDQNFSRRQSPLSNSMELLKGSMQAYGAIEGRTKSDLEVNEKPTQNPQVGNNIPTQNPPTQNPQAENIILQEPIESKLTVTRDDLNALGKYYAGTEYKEANPDNSKQKGKIVDKYKSEHINQVREKIGNSKLTVQKMNAMTPIPEAEITMNTEDIENIQIAKQWQQQEKAKVNIAQKEVSQEMGI